MEKRCKALRAKGRLVELDHIVPLKSPLVCGLHVHWNMQIITEQQNRMKSNTFWPGHPLEEAHLQLDLFGDAESGQLTLI